MLVKTNFQFWNLLKDEINKIAFKKYDNEINKINFCFKILKIKLSKKGKKIVLKYFFFE